MRRLAPAGLYLAGLQFYLYHLHPGCGYIDAPRYAQKAWQLDLGVGSIDHPLYALLGHAAMRLPLGNLAYRLNCLTAVFGALACALVFLAGRRLGHRDWAGAAAAAGLATGWNMWSSSVEAEVYGLNAVFTLGILWAVLHWLDHRSLRSLAVAGFLLGLGLANHQMVVLAFPALLAALAVATRPNSPPAGPPAGPGLLRAAAVLAAAAAAGFAPYAWLIARQLARTGPADTLGRLSGGEFGPLVFGAPSPAAALGYAARFGLILFANFDIWQFPIGLLGMYILLRRRPAAGAALAGTALAVVVFVVGYQVPDRIYFYLPAIALFALGVGEGAERLLAGLAGLPVPDAARRAAGTLAIAALLFPVVSKPRAYDVMAGRLAPRLAEFQRRFPDLRIPEIPGRDGVRYYVFPGKRHEHGALHYRRLLEAAPPGAVLVDDWQHGYAILADYDQRTVGLRPDVEVIRWFEIYGGSPEERQRRLERIAARVRAGRTVWLTGLDYPASTLIERLGPGFVARPEGDHFRLETAVPPAPAAPRLP